MHEVEADFLYRGQDHALLEHELLDDFKTNVIGNINLFNLFMPLILKGKQKKILYISSGHGDLDLINQVHIAISGPYAIGKAAANVAVAKLNAEYAKDGVMLMSISPGVVDTGIIDPSKRKSAMVVSPDFRSSVTSTE